MCVKCSPPEKRKSRRQPSLRPVSGVSGATVAVIGADTAATGPVSAASTPVADATRAALEAVDRVSSPMGSSALLLAGLLDSGGYNAAGAAALAKAHRETLESALKGAPKANDAVDELLSRRLRSG
jgi:hypothetical protein